MRESFNPVEKSEPRQPVKDFSLFGERYRVAMQEVAKADKLIRRGENMLVNEKDPKIIERIERGRAELEATRREWLEIAENSVIAHASVTETQENFDGKIGNA